MKFTFFSNFLNHHQLPFCKEMNTYLGDNFKFVATEPIHQERLDLGYQDMSNLYPFSINAFDSKAAYDQAMELGYGSDVVMIGSAPDVFIDKRVADDKLTFRYAERIFKKGRWRILSPRGLLNLYSNHTKYRNKKLYMLCASAYTAGDFALVGAYLQKTYKWGYFPENKVYELSNLMGNKKNNKPSLLWVGRFLDWKHPEKAILTARWLRDQGYDFSLDMIGTGIMLESISSMIRKYNLDSHVKLRGSMSPNEVRNYMEKANIFLFTSDYNEGWGAVLNESMNSGCAVVASDAIGSVPFMIYNNYNGLIYKNNHLATLFDQVKLLMDAPDLCNAMGTNAYETVEQTWNAKTAATRLLEFSNELLNQKLLTFHEGPLSIAATKIQIYQ